MASDRNSIPELLELLLRASPLCDDQNEIEIHVELRAATTEIDGPDALRFTVGLKRAWLDLDLTGLEPVPGTRRGEPTRGNEIPTSQQFSKETTVQNEMAAKAKMEASRSALDGALSLAAGHESKAKMTVSTTSTDAASYFRVKARGNLMWEITESPQLNPLDATYLNNEVLCRVKPMRGANAKTVSLTAFAKQRDITLSLAQGGNKLLFRSANHEKMLKVLISKALSASKEEFGGVIHFSASEIDIEN